MAAGPAKKSKDGIISRVVFFVVVIGILLGVIQYATGGIKFGEDGWFTNYREGVSGVVEDGSGEVKKHIEDATDGVGTKVGDGLREQLNVTPSETSPTVPESTEGQ